MKRPYKRRRILVDGQQYRLLAVTLTHSFIIFGTVAAVLFVPLMIRLKSSTLSLVEKEEAAKQFLTIDARAWPALLLLFVLLMIHSVFVSHKIFGPLYSFRRVLKAVGEGNLFVRATIRKHDYLVKEANSINEMIASLRTRVTGVREHSAQARAVLGELKRAIRSESMEEVNHTIEKLAAQMDRIEASVDQFRIAGGETCTEDDLASSAASVSPSGDSAEVTDS